MNRFLMLLAVAAVAGGTYVATAPGSAMHAPPTWKQYSATLKKLNALKKEVGLVKAEADDADGFVHVCLLGAGVAPVGQFGDATNGTYGFQYVPSMGAPAVSRGALDIDSSSQPQAFFQSVSPACITSGAAAPGSRHAGGLPLRTERAR